MAGEREKRKKKNLSPHLALRYPSHLAEEGKPRFLSQPYKSRVPLSSWKTFIGFFVLEGGWGEERKERRKTWLP